MAQTLSFVFSLCGLLLAVNPAMSQSSDGSPYGGIAVTPGSIPIGLTPSAPGTPPPSGSGSGLCPDPDPCVVTGQNDRYRTSTNVKASKLAAFSATNASSFGQAYFYQLPTANAAYYNYEPVVAQPLYATHVLQPDGVHYKNLLIVASLANWVYAYDTSGGTTSTPLWSTQLKHCGGSGSVPFKNDKGGEPGGVAQLPYYGSVATPVIDTTPSTAFVFVVSA